MLSPLLYSLFIHDCVAKHDSNTIIELADDTTVEGLITDNNETAYREEVKDLAVWYQYNNLSLNLIKTKEMIVNYRKRRAEQRLFPLRRLKRFGMGPQILKKFYSCTVESTMTLCITFWYGNLSLEILFMSLFWFGQGVRWGGHFNVLFFYDFLSLCFGRV